MRDLNKNIKSKYKNSEPLKYNNVNNNNAINNLKTNTETQKYSPIFSKLKFTSENLLNKGSGNAKPSAFLRPEKESGFLHSNQKFDTISIDNSQALIMNNILSNNNNNVFNKFVDNSCYELNNKNKNCDFSSKPDKGEETKSFAVLLKNQSEKESVGKPLNTPQKSISNKKNLEFFVNKTVKKSDELVLNFTSLGIFSLENNDKTEKIYFDVLHRHTEINEGKCDYLEDFFFYDITDLMNYKQQIFEENIKKQKILAKIAHEFKTPLNSIISMIDRIKDSDIILAENTQYKLEMICNLSNYVTFLISDIIQYADISDISDMKINNNTVINIKEILSFCFDILNTLMDCNRNKKDNITAHLQIDEIINYCEIRADEIRLKQILLNFISNAIKFTKNGHIKLKCKKTEIENKNFIIISVKDTGIGIKEADIKLVGKEFYVLNDQDFSTTKSLGSGLGLNICIKLIEKMNFVFDFKSKYRNGSKFSILIPETNFTIKNSGILMESATVNNRQGKINFKQGQNKLHNETFISAIKEIWRNNDIPSQRRRNSFDSLELKYLGNDNKIHLDEIDIFENTKITLDNKTNIIKDENFILEKNSGIRKLLRMVNKPKILY